MYPVILDISLVVSDRKPVATGDFDKTSKLEFFSSSEYNGLYRGLKRGLFNSPETTDIMVF